VRDASLCHGAAGNAHLFHRWYALTGEPVFAEAARTWYAHALGMPPPESMAFLEGAAGIALALVAATTEIEPAWDRVLLASGPR
jgi:hypothetical protein